MTTGPPPGPDSPPAARVIAPAALVDSALPGAVSRSVDVAISQLVRIGAARIPATEAQTSTDTSRDTFATSVAGWGVEVSVGRGVLRTAPDGRVLPATLSSRLARVRPATPTGEAGIELARRAWARTRVRRLPAFTGGTRDRLDLLVTALPGEWSPALALAGDLGEVIRVIADGANDLGLNVTSIRSPSAGLSDEQWLHADSRADPPLEGVDPLLARGVNVRATLALDDPTTDDRIGMIAQLLVAAEHHGWGLHVADRRYGALRGHWVCLRRLKATAPDPLPDPAGRALVPVTLLGPTRQGSGSAAMLAISGATVLAFSGVGLGGIDIMNAVLDVPRRTPDPPGADVEVQPVPIARLPELLGTGSTGDPDREPGPGFEAADYVALVSPSVDLSDLAPAAQTSPVWVQFEVRDLGDGSPDPEYAGDVLDLFDQASPPIDGRPDVEYHQQRWADGRRRVRVERMKLALRLAPPAPGDARDPAARLLALCEDVQNRQRATAANGRPGGRVGRVANFRVAARERWLGTWLDDPG